VAATEVRKHSDGSPNIVDQILAGEVDLIVNTPFGRGARSDGYFIRTAAVLRGVPCITTLAGLQAAVQGIESTKQGFRVAPLQEYLSEVAASWVSEAESQVVHSGSPAPEESRHT
jgi:carbamoyl-phosphate synthase large subunit